MKQKNHIILLMRLNYIHIIAFESSTVITEGTVVLGVAVAKAAAGLVLNVAVNGEAITVE